MSGEYEFNEEENQIILNLLQAMRTSSRLMAGFGGVFLLIGGYTSANQSWIDGVDSLIISAILYGCYFFTQKVSTNLQAIVDTEGSDITLLGWGAQIEILQKAAEMALEDGVSCEIIDLRSILPWDAETVMQSVMKTGRLLVNHEAPLSGGFASEIAATIQERCFLYLEAPIARVCGLDTPYPLAHEKEYMPDETKTYEAIKRTLHY